MTEAKKKPERPVKVKTVKSGNETALVETVKDGKLCRHVIPLAALTDKGVLPSELELGVEYGIPWEHELKLDATVEELADNLRAAGLWTAEDVVGNYNKVLGVLQATYGVDLGEISRVAYSYLKKEGGS